MCGRFVSTTSPDELAEYFGAGEVIDDSNWTASYNVAPSQPVLAVYEEDGVRSVAKFRWGLVPSWAKDPKIGNRMINARSETIAEKNSFKRPFSRSRCIIPADGFYEWMKPKGSGPKQPMYMTRVDDAPFAFAGLWDVWNGADRSGGAAGSVHSCTIITGRPNDKVAKVHDRMPVMLPPSHWDAWLDRDNHDTSSLLEMMVPAPSALIVVSPVSTDVNNVRNNRPDLIEPIEADQSAT